MTPTHLTRFTQSLVLAAVVAALAAPTMALGGSNPGKSASDWFERYAAAHPFGHAIGASAEAPDWFERYVARHTPPVALDGRSPDTRDASEAAQVQAADGRAPDTLDAVANTQLQVADGRSADTLDAVANTRLQVADGRSADTLDATRGSLPIETVRPGGRFDWGDAGIGAMFATMAIALIAGTMLMLARSHRRQRVQAT